MVHITWREELRRRHWLVGGRQVFLFVLAAIGWTFAASVDAADRGGPLRIGALTESWGATPQIVGLRDGLVALGYQENRDFFIGVRFTEGDSAALPTAAQELVRRGADIIFASDGRPAKAALEATDRVPIVFAGGGDPLRLGLIQSYARPGGRVTGVTDTDLELGPKRLEMFRALMPGLRRVLFVYNAADEYALAEARLYRDAAARLGIELVEKAVTTQDQAHAAIAEIKRGQVDGIVQPRFVSLNIPGFVLEATTRRGIPAVFAGAFWVERGALVSYGPDLYEAGRQAARLVDKIHRGADPAQIPVEASPKVELAINLKTAKALKIAIPRDILYRADKIVQ